MNRTAVIYARVSSSGDRQSTDRQVADLRAFAKREGFEVLEVFSENCSGAREDRPELLRCVEYLKRGGCSTLLVSEISRLGRSVKGVVNTIDELTRAKVNIYLQDINLYTLLHDGSENPLAKVILTVLALGAEIERQSIVRRLNSGRERAKEKGVKLGRPKGSMMSNQELLNKYPEVVKKLRKGRSIREIAKICDVSASTVQRIKKAMK